jgi:hypothetical protein
MATRVTLCAAVSAAALVIGVSTMASAEVKKTTTTRTTTVRTTAPVHTNVVHSNTVRTNTVRTTTTTTQFKKLNNVSNTSSGNPKFHKTFTTPSNVHVTPTTLKVNPNLTVKPNPNLTVNPNLKFAPNLHASPALKLGPGVVSPALKPFKGPFVQLGNNKVAPIWKSQYKIWWGGKWKVFVPFTAIGVVLIGGAYYYPDAYVGFARPYCTGLTPDGCQLNWQMVNFEDGGSDWQCVQFCPRPNAMPPPQAVALTPPPPMPQGSCEVTIFSDQNFAGTGVTTGEEQPQLSQSGWQNQIASIQVKSGVWDFFTDENFTGNTMRLQPGPYQDLGPDWTKKIGSFMCIQPGQ